MSLDAVLGNVWNNGSEVELGGGLNFIGFTVAYNPTTKRIDLTFAGGGGSRHVIQDEGSSLADQPTLNFVGPNVSAANAGGKTVVTIGPVNLASGVSGVLPIANGGTGLSAVGASNTVLTGNGTSWAMAQVQNAHISATAAIAWSKLADGTAAGQQPFWDGSAWRKIGLLTGTNLTDANQTLAIAGGAQYLQSASLTASRDKRLALAGATKGLMITLYSLATRAFALVVKDDASGAVLFTFPASATPIVASFRFNDAETAFDLAGWAPLGTVV
jgi:hypothetical protein